MYAVAFDLTVTDTEKYHPKGRFTGLHGDRRNPWRSMAFAACKEAFM
jgi:virulence-associated protein VapD